MQSQSTFCCSCLWKSSSSFSSRRSHAFCCSACTRSSSFLFNIKDWEKSWLKLIHWKRWEHKIKNYKYVNIWRSYYALWCSACACSVSFLLNTIYRRWRCVMLMYETYEMWGCEIVNIRNIPESRKIELEMHSFFFIIIFFFLIIF